MQYVETQGNVTNGTSPETHVETQGNVNGISPQIPEVVNDFPEARSQPSQIQHHELVIARAEINQYNDPGQPDDVTILSVSLFPQQ